MVENVIINMIIQKVVNIVYLQSLNLYSYKLYVSLLCIIGKEKRVVLGHTFAQQSK
jgi:hypothetical protein